MTTFISYSRRQLYFAESLALHLQKEGLDIWFDLQQLQAGKVWSEGLTDGIHQAERLVLVVSKASLESPYTQAEWRGVAEKGRQVILVINEAVDLPKELHGLPSYDFRSGFNKKLQDLVAFLKEDGEPRYDHVPAPNRLGIPLRLPNTLWFTLAALFGTLIAGFLGLILSISLNSAKFLPGVKFFWILLGLSTLIGVRYAVPLLRHKLEYKKVKRGALISIVLLLPMVFAVGSLLDGVSWVPYYTVLPMLGFTMFVYAIVVRRSADLLRWMQPEDTLQKLRRRVHQPLAAKAIFDVDTVAEQAANAARYAIHADRADEPFVRFIEGVFRKAGHTRVASDKDAEHHIAILSNRSSEVWTQEVTQAYAGKLVFVVTSTIEFKENLTETGRYQWVDARDGDRLDIATLARSLGDPGAWKREAALEATPAMIDLWKVPGGITLLKRVMELYGIFVLVFGLTDLVGFVMNRVGLLDPSDQSGGSLLRAVVLVVVGLACFGLVSKALIYRKVPAPVLYGFFGGTVFLVSWLEHVLSSQAWGQTLPGAWWFVPAVILPLLLYSALTSHFWMPAFAKPNPDEVGIKKSIDQAFKRRTVIVVSAWVVGIIVSVVLVLLIKS